MRGFLPGLLVGVLIGAGGVYLALEKPWAGADSAEVAADAGPQVAAKKPKKRKKRKKRAGAAADTNGDGIPELTDADRKLVTKGDKVVLPTKEIDMAAGGEARALSSSEINDTIRSRSSAMIDCIESSTAGAALKSKVTLKLLVGPDGRVKKTRITAPAWLFAHDFNSCARRAASDLVFPPTGAHTVVTAPFDIY